MLYTKVLDELCQARLIASRKISSPYRSVFMSVVVMIPTINIDVKEAVIEYIRTLVLIAERVYNTAIRVFSSKVQLKFTVILTIA
jgi:hypothetical protein